MSSTHAPTNDELGSTSQRERRERILDATIALASQGGFDAVQMRAVAERADVALGTLYRYFPSKIHLLVSGLAREFERAEERLATRALPGDTPADRVVAFLRRTTRGLQDDPHLTDALTRAFMFADRSAAQEIDAVGVLLTRMLTRAMRADPADVSDDDTSDDTGDDTSDGTSDDDTVVARVIGDVWLAALVAWVTGRSTAEETAAHLDRAVRLILR